LVILAAAVLGAAMWLSSCRDRQRQAVPEGPAAAIHQPTPVTADPPPPPSAPPRMKWQQMEPHTQHAGFVALEPGETEALIIYSGSLHGLLEACGCPGNPSGGLGKELTVVNRVRQGGLPSLYLNPGDLFPYEKQPLKMKFIAEAAALMKYDALTIGDQELVEGLPRFRELAGQYHLPYLSENLRGPAGERLAPGVMIKDLAGIKVGIIAVMGDESYLYFRSAVLTGMKIEPVADAVQAALAQLEKKVDYVILLSHQDKYLDRDLAERFQSINLIIGGHDEELLRNPVLVGDSLRVDAGAGGDNVGVLHLAINPKRAVRVLGNELIPAAGQVPAEARVAKIYRDYLEVSKEKVTPAADLVPPVYEPAEICGTCHGHRAIYAEFKATPHARAWQSLVEAGRADDRQCWSCHAMGYGRQSGFRDIQATPGLANVSCQACHLVPHDHVARQIKDDLDFARDQRTCLQCHTPVTSPDFNYWESYEKVDHHAVKEKHNAPPAK
jgi:hypothetical protein